MSRSGEGASRLLLLLATLALVVGAVELGAHGLEWASERFGTQRFVEVRNPVPVFEEVREGGAVFYARTKHHELMLPGTRFAKEKPAETFRVFLLGGSAAGGWPFDLGGYTLADLLERKLQRLLPDVDVEVHNVAGGTYASHRVRFVFDEVIDYQPDLLLVYSGHNEFLEQFVYRETLPEGPLRHSAVARIVHRWREASRRPSFDVENYSLADQTSNRLAYAFGRASRYRKDPAQLQGLLDNYRQNLDWMVRESQRRGVPIALLDAPVNLRSWRPNASQHGAVTAEARARWQRAFREGLLAFEAGRMGEAAAALGAALEADDEYAEAWYYRGLALLELGDVDDGRAALIAALERDAYPFRAIPQLQAVIDEVASRHGALRVRTTPALEALSAHGIPGAEVFVDYVHLTEQAQEVVAHEVARVLVREGLLPHEPAVALEATRIQTPTEFRPDVALRSSEGLYRQYLVMRQYDGIDAVYQQLVDALERAPEVRPDLADYCKPRLELARQLHAVLRPYRRLLRAQKLGILEQEFTPEQARRIYAAYVTMIRHMEAPDMPRERFREFVPPLRVREDAAPG